MSPTISVIIPAHNAAVTIKATLDSVLYQSFQDFEIIVIIDNSSDSTLTIVENYQDPRIKVISHPSGSAAISRNKGLRYAIGKYIAFLDADDLWQPEKLEMQLRALQEASRARVAYCWVDCINSQGQFIQKGARCEHSGDVYDELLTRNFLFNGSNPLIYKDTLEKIGNFDESLSNAEDLDLYLRLAKDHHFTLVPHPLVSYRRSYSSKSFMNPLGMEASYIRIMTKACVERPEAVQILVNRGFPHFYKRIIFQVLENPALQRRNLVAFTLLYRFACKKAGFFKNLELKLYLFYVISKQSLRSFFSGSIWKSEQYRQDVQNIQNL